MNRFDSHDIFHIVLIILLGYLFIIGIFEINSNTKEGLGKIKDIANKVKDAANRIPGQVNNFIGQTGNVTRRIGSEFRSLGRLSTNALREIESLPSKGDDLFNQATEFVKKESKKLEKGIKKDIFGPVDNFVTGTFGGLKNDMNGSFQKLASFSTEFFNIVKNSCENIFGGFFRSLEGFFNKIKIGFMLFFNGIGDIFSTIFDTFIDIFYTFVNLPFCVPYYLYDMTESILKSILPKWIKDILRWCKTYIIIPIMKVFEFIARLIGFNFNYSDKHKRKCYPNFMGTISNVSEKTLGFFILIFQQLIGVFSNKNRRRRSLLPTTTRRTNRRTGYISRSSNRQNSSRNRRSGKSRRSGRSRRR